jgi:hypothetical protein
VLIDKVDELLAQRRLADAWLTNQHHQCAASSRGSLKDRLELPQLRFSADERRPRD